MSHRNPCNKAGIKILVVDDNAENLYLNRKLLEAHGFVVETAADGIEALQKSRSDPPDLLVSDILMPRMDGFALCREWKKDPRLRTIPFVFCTATFTTARDRELALDLGAERFIVKPIDPDRYLETLKEVLAECQATDGDESRLPSSADEKEQLERHSEVLLGKLEKKMSLLEELNAQLMALQEASLAMTSSLGLDEVLQQIAQGAKEALNSRAVGIFIVDEVNRVLINKVLLSDDPHAIQSLVDSLDLQRSGDEITPLPLVEDRNRLTDAALGLNAFDGPPFTDAGAETSRDGSDRRLDSPVGQLIVPMVVKRRCVGVMALIQGASHPLTENERPVSEALARQAAICIENSRLFDETRRSEMRYRDIFEAASDAILVCDRQSGTILDANRRACEMFGFSCEELCRSVLHALGAEESPAFFLDGAEPRTGADPRDPRLHEWLARRSDGSVFWTEVNQRDTEIDGRECVLVVIRDIDARKRFDEELRQSQKLRAIGQLASGITHDFNNILTAMFGYIDFLDDELEIDHPSRENVVDLRKTTERATDLTSRLLAFSRARVLCMEVVDLNDVVRETETMIKPLIGENVAMERALSPHELFVEAEAGQIGQVLINLVINARDAMPRGGMVTVRTCLETCAGPGSLECADMNPGDYVLLSVSDSGDGMTSDVQERIFDPFFTTKTPERGTGLGLFTVFGIVKQHHGYIDVQSAPGAGSTFNIYLPRVEQPVEPFIAPDDVQARLPRGHASVLIVEDDDDVRRVTALTLSGSGYEVLTARDPDEALLISRNRKEPLELLVTDVVMPQMDGFCLYQELLVFHPELKVLYMSGYATGRKAPASLMDAGTSIAFVQKPFTGEELVRLVHRTLGETPPHHSEVSADR